MGHVQNIVEKGENAGYQHFLLFSQCFPKLSRSGSLNIGMCDKELRLYKISVKSDYLVYSYTDGLSAFKLPLGNKTNLIPLSSTRNVKALEFDSENKEILMVQADPNNNVT